MFNTKKSFSLALVFCFLLSQPLEAQAKNKIIRGPYLQSVAKESIVLRWRTKNSASSIVRISKSLEDLKAYNEKNEKNWRKRVPRDFRIAAGELNMNSSIKQVQDLLLKKDHELTIDNLEPDTRYYYSIHARKKSYQDHKTSSFIALSKANEDKYFKTQALNADSTRVWILGDSGGMSSKKFTRRYGDAQEDVRDAYYNLDDKATSAILMLGDNAYYHGTDEEYQIAVFEVYKEIIDKTPLYPVFGNHDYGLQHGTGEYSASASPEPKGAYFDIFTLPSNAELGGTASKTEAYYSFDYNNVHFVMLDSTDSLWQGVNKASEKFTEDLKFDVSKIWFEDSNGSNAMIDWLKQDLANTKQEWKIVAFHHAPYNNHELKGKDFKTSRWIRYNIVPILEQYNVDIVFAGHYHRYKRSYPLHGYYDQGPNAFQESMIQSKKLGKPDLDSAYKKNEGTIYVIAGSGGALSKSDGDDHPTTLSLIEDFGSIVLDIEAKKLDFRFLDKEGEVRDYFTIVK